MNLTSEEIETIKKTLDCSVEFFDNEQSYIYFYNSSGSYFMNYSIERELFAELFADGWLAGWKLYSKNEFFKRLKLIAFV
jgi:hypothetical protein